MAIEKITVLYGGKSSERSISLESGKHLFQSVKHLGYEAELVDYPSEVVISETAGESIVILEISVSPDDVGKVIGKEGRIANAIRTVVKAAAAKHDKKVTVEILTKKEG